MKISVVIITLNEAQNIARCLDSVQSITDEIVVVDSFSTDETEKICKRYANLVFIQNKFVNYGLQHQFATDKATYNWVLSIDADEVLSDGLVKEICELKQHENSAAAYYLRFSTLYQGKILKYCGLGNEKHLRLFNKNYCRFTDAAVHEEVIVEGETGILQHKIIHTPYQNLHHHLEKINKYTDLFADGKARKGKQVSKIKIITKSSIRFWTIYFVKLAILDGYAGFVWATMGAYYSFLKYAKLKELQN